MSLTDRVCKGAHRSITQVGGMTSVETVSQSKHKLKFGAKLEKRHVKVTAQACLKIDIISLELEYIIIFPAEVDDRAQACHDIRPVVACTLRGIDDVRRAGDIDGLEILCTAAETIWSLRVIIAKGNMAAAEVKSRGNTKRKVIVQSCLAEHTYVKAIVICILVGGDGIRLCRTVIKRERLRPDIQQFHILDVCTYKDAEMKRPQVGIRSILHRAVLSIGTNTEQEGKNEAKETLHINDNANLIIILCKSLSLGIHISNYSAGRDSFTL